MATPLPPLNLTGGAATATAQGGNSGIAPFTVNFPSLQRPAATNSAIIGVSVVIAIFGGLLLLRRK